MDTLTIEKDNKKMPVASSPEHANDEATEKTSTAHESSVPQTQQQPLAATEVVAALWGSEAHRPSARCAGKEHAARPHIAPPTAYEQTDDRVDVLLTPIAAERAGLRRSHRESAVLSLVHFSERPYFDDDGGNSEDSCCQSTGEPCDGCRKYGGQFQKHGRLYRHNSANDVGGGAETGQRVHHIDGAVHVDRGAW